MKRNLGLVLLTLALGLMFSAGAQAARAQDEGEAGRKKDQAKKKGEGKPDEAPVLADTGAAENIKKLLARLHENMDGSEEKLGNKDTGEGTRKIQDQILRDLDELIKQQNQGGGGGASPSGGGAGGAGSKGGSPSAGGTKGGSGGAGGKGGSKKDAQNAKGGDAKKDNKLATDEDSTLKDAKNRWGHLPLKKREEMDAYARQRFLPRYEELLRQYYRTISEQGRRKEGDAP